LELQISGVTTTRTSYFKEAIFLDLQFTNSSYHTDTLPTFVSVLRHLLITTTNEDDIHR